MNEKELRPVTEKIVSEFYETLHYPLKNIRVRLKKETKKGLFTTIIDVRSAKDGKIVAKKTENSIERSVQKAKDAVYKQINKLHSIRKKKDIHHYWRDCHPTVGGLNI